MRTTTDIYLVSSRLVVFHRCRFIVRGGEREVIIRGLERDSPLDSSVILSAYLGPLHRSFPLSRTRWTIGTRLRVSPTRRGGEWGCVVIRSPGKSDLSCDLLEACHLLCRHLPILTKERIFEIVNLESLLFGVWAEEEEEKEKQGRAEKSEGASWVGRGQGCQQASPSSSHRYRTGETECYCPTLSANFRHEHIQKPLYCQSPRFFLY